MTSLQIESRQRGKTQIQQWYDSPKSKWGKILKTKSWFKAFLEEDYQYSKDEFQAFLQDSFSILANLANACNGAPVKYQYKEEPKIKYVKKSGNEYADIFMEALNKAQKWDKANSDTTSSELFMNTFIALNQSPYLLEHIAPDVFKKQWGDPNAA